MLTAVAVAASASAAESANNYFKTHPYKLYTNKFCCKLFTLCFSLSSLLLLLLVCISYSNKYEPSAASMQ